MSRPFSTWRRRRVATIAALLGTALAGAVVTPSALAGSYEQIGRDTGADGWSRFTGLNRPVLASDSGRYGIYLYAENLFPGKSKARYFIRDIVTNTSRQLGDERLYQVFGIDQAERTILAARRLADNSGELIALPADGGIPRILAPLPAGDSFWAAISGDGKTAALADYSGTLGLRTVSIDTGKITKIADGRFPIGPRALSDDGRIIAVSQPPAGAYFVNGRRTNTAGPTVVAPNGSVAITFTDTYLTEGSKITVRRIATGAQKQYAPPAGIVSATVSWIAPDGGSVIVSPADTGGTQPAQRLDFATGKWTPLTGPYAGAFDLLSLLDYDYGDNPISRNGKYAVLGYSPLGIVSPKQAALVNVSGGDLPGDQESLSASSYLGVGPVLTKCGEGGSIIVNFARPASWAPAPRRADLTIVFNGNTAGAVKKTFAAPATDRFDYVEIPVPTGTKWATIRGNVIDGAGKYLTTSETLEVPCLQYTEW